MAMGSISIGIARDTLVNKTIEFARDQLEAWRDHKDRVPEQGEDKLNGQWCKFLNAAARRAFPMVQFNREEPQAGRRTVDLSATPVTPLTVGSRDYSIYEPFLVMEGKRLPAPSRDREREYLTGFAKRSGGVQRFKLGLHGAKLATAVMLGYLQSGSANEWRCTINRWVRELAAVPDTSDDSWDESEGLQSSRQGTKSPVAVARSTHPRTGCTSDPITLVHLWIEM